MRVLMVIESLGLGGAERALVTLVTALRRRGVDVDIAALAGPYTLATELESTGATVFRLDVPHRWNLWASVQGLRHRLREGRYDVVHAHLFFPEIASGLLRAFGGTTRVVWTSHSLAYDPIWARRPWWDRTRRVLHRTLAKRCVDVHTAVSRPVAEHVERHLHVPHIDVIPNGFDFDALRPKPYLDRVAVLDTIAPKLSSRFVIMLPGRLAPEKGHTFLLRAIVSLRERGHTPSAVLAGAGPLEAELRTEIKRHGLDSQVHFTGVLPHATLLEVMQAVDLVAMPSVVEGLPLAAIEALALERPLVASRVGGLPDVVDDGESGLLVPPGDSGALAGVLETLMLNASLRSRLGVAGRNRSVERFAIEQTTERWLELYRSLEGARPTYDDG